MKTLIIAEHDNKNVKLSTHHTISAAKELKHPYDILIVGYDCKSVAEEAILLTDSQVLLCEDKVYEHQLAENIAELIKEVAQDYDYLLIPGSTFGKNILPRTAALLDVAMISDVTKIIASDTFERPIYAGNVLAVVQSFDQKKLLSIRTTAFPAAQALETTASIKTLSNQISNSLSTFQNQTLTKSSRPELTNAKIIISGGRGLKSAENFKLIEQIADQLGAAVGASRAAVDAGFAPNDYQVGQTGKVVAPELYIAVGISGAIQHLAGMKDSKVIVAINNDPDAPIFQIADYGLVGDLFKILPELQEALSK